MCSIYQVDSSINDLLQIYNTILPDNHIIFEHPTFEIPDRVYPKSYAPILHLEKGKLVLSPMHYSLIPHWSKDLNKTLKYATFNARVETIDQKPTFRDAFRNNRCLVPLTDFIEPIYTGDHAGNMVRFFEKKHQLLTVAGIYDRWKNPETGDIINSFAIITDKPSPFIAEIGHKRSPIFLSENGFNEWLNGNENKSDELKDLLNKVRTIPSFDVENDRALKAGWEKRRS